MGNFIEIIITILIVTAALFFFIKSIRKKSSGGCDCSNCNKNCSLPKYTSSKEIKK